MLESPATLRPIDPPTPRAARRRTVCPAHLQRPTVAAHDPSDPDYTAGDVDELLRWQRRAARGAAPTPR